jgi:hypothetical protein
MILNDDDILFTDAIETIIQLFNSHKDLFLIGCTCIPFTDARTIDKRKILDLHQNQEIPLILHSPKEVPGYCGPNEINMTHSACTFFKVSWEFVGGYYENKKSRVIPSSDRDFQLRINCIFPIGVSYEIPFVFWRADSSVDSGLYS